MSPCGFFAASVLKLSLLPNPVVDRLLTTKLYRMLHLPYLPQGDGVPMAPLRDTNGHGLVLVRPEYQHVVVLNESSGDRVYIRKKTKTTLFCNDNGVGTAVWGTVVVLLLVGSKGVKVVGCGCVRHETCPVVPPETTFISVFKKQTKRVLVFACIFCGALFPYAYVCRQASGRLRSIRTKYQILKDPQNTSG